MRRELLLGCGHDLRRKVTFEDRQGFEGLVTLDVNREVSPDVVFDLSSDDPLPFADDSFDEVHAYDVLEHTRQQGDWRGFFREFSEFWRVLRPGGYVCGLVPRHDRPWAWGDPGHTRVIQRETLGFLDQAAYAAECRPGGTNRTDYRFAYRADFHLRAWEDLDVQSAFVLEAVKPSRWGVA